MTLRRNARHGGHAGQTGAADHGPRRGNILLPMPPPPGGIRYSHILDSIADAIRSGAIAPGERLPTQRELADRFGVALGTVSRAYAEAARRGLIAGTVGRGTFALPPSEALHLAVRDGVTETINLTINRPSPAGAQRAFASTLQAIAKHPGLDRLLADYPAVGSQRHRQAAVSFIRRAGHEVSPDEITICNGTQHALAVILGAIAEPGEAVLTEGLNYPGVRLLEQIYRLRLIPVDLDIEGMRPDALEAACRLHGARIVIVTPTLHNPTTRTMSALRRRAIADVIRRNNLVLIEDDIYGPLMAQPLPPISSEVRDQSYYITGTSKCLATGVRLGYLCAPARSLPRLTMALQATAWIAPALMAEILTRWIEDGSLDAIISFQRAEAAHRHEIVDEILAGAKFERDVHACSLWLHLPEPWRQASFADQARGRGILVLPAEVFIVGRSAAPHAVRVSFGEVDDDEKLRRGLATLAGLLAEQPFLQAVGV